MQPRQLQFWPKGVPHTLPVPRTTLNYNLEVSAVRYPDKTAISYYGGRLAYSELKRQVDVLAGYLQTQCGVKKGERAIIV